MVSRAPAGEGTQDVVVLPMTKEHRAWWDSTVQPFIDALPKETVRADRGWRWSKIRKVELLAAAFSGKVAGAVSGAESFGELLGQRPEAYTLGLISKTAEFFPVGMLTLCGVFRCEPVDGLTSPCVFLWYMSGAPGAFLELVAGTQSVGLITRLLLDTAVCRSWALGEDGRLLLHADQGGQARLLQWYQKQGMKTVPSEIEKVSRLRENDGRYLYFDGPGAVTFLESNSRYR